MVSSALFFIRSDKLGDTFEGSFSKANMMLRPQIYSGQSEMLQ
ncbi:hypothetical protein DGWBC_1359 [Dehalogenimonas sp. WBC-2]|nr:hypothetical protein DGWBC_1359 [Dehalogenimonas sp. WBC-2]